jgi:hypothetical protein
MVMTLGDPIYSPLGKLVMATKMSRTDFWQRGITWLQIYWHVHA